MQHAMMLHPAPLAKLRAGTKTIEMRVLGIELCAL